MNGFGAVADSPDMLAIGWMEAVAKNDMFVNFSRDFSAYWVEICFRDKQSVPRSKVCVFRL